MSDITTLMMGAAGAGGGGAETDPNFNQTTLLLHGDGTNGAQNNTFLDSSTNTFTITRNGNTTQGTFSPFSLADGEWSNFFANTNTQYLTLSNSGLSISSSQDFTIEFWYNLTVINSFNCPFSSYQNSSDGLTCYVRDGAILFYYAGDSSISGSATSVVGQWHHLAISGTSGSSIKMFHDGVQIGTTSSATISNTGTGTNFAIGRFIWGGSAYEFPGYISNFSINVGTAKYTSSFTPSTTPLATNTTNQKLLTCYNNRFGDFNTATTAKTITVNGTPSVQPFSPYAPSAAYDPSVNGGSGYFDGTGDYLTAPDSASWAFGAGNFTIEAWVYRTASGDPFIFNQSDGATTAGGSFIFFVASGKLATIVYYNTSSFIILTSSANLPVNEWVHIAVVRTSGTISQYINGVRDGTNGSLSTNALNDVNRPLEIGTRNGSGLFTGYISSARIIKGTGPYDATSSTLTVPTAPLTAVSGTELLLLAQNAGIFDNTGKNNLETVGNAQIDTSVKKYGTGSMEFDGTGDYLVAPSTPDTILSGDFTIEGWVYRASSGSYRFFTVGDSSGATGIEVYVSGTPTGNWVVYSNSATRITGATATREVWTHLAVVRSGSTVTFYVNGSASGSTWSSSATFSGRVFVGAEFFSGSVTADTNGYIDDFRISRVARYLTTFTPPTAAFPDL